MTKIGRATDSKRISPFLDEYKNNKNKHISVFTKEMDQRASLDVKSM